jgi:hypothetical protein
MAVARPSLSCCIGQPRGDRCCHNYLLDLQEVPEEFSDVAHYLQLPARDEVFRNQMRGEKEIDDIFELQAAGHKKEMELMHQQMEEIERQKQKAENDRIKAEEEKRKTEKEKEILLVKYIRSLHLQGLSAEQIGRETGMDVEKIKELL